MTPTKQQRIQEEQYELPYHYMPQIREGHFSQHAYWSWGYRYLGGMHVAKSLCDRERWSSLLDLGCGDGRFISELAKDSDEDRRLTGIDYSKRAIALAKALNPGLDYRVSDIIRDDPGTEKYDVVTLIEVIEHIRPDDLPAFVESAVSFLRPGGRLVLTVPHRNNPVGSKHFQHFDSEMLSALLDKHLDDLQFQPFDFFSRFLDIWFRLIGRTGQFFVITWPPLLNAFYRHYLSKCLLGDDESKCGRIACVGRKPE